MMKVLLINFILCQALAECPFLQNLDPKGPLAKTALKHAEDVECKDENLPSFQVDPDPETTTVMGCECESNCGATLDFGNANCDWCYTKNNCGHYAYTRLAYYDYCLYPLKDSEAEEWEQKQIMIWNGITADSTPGEYPNLLGLLSASIQTSFDDQWDVMPAGRVKYIHSIGAVCLVNMDVTSTKYTGILGNGMQHGIIRMGSAAEIGSSGTTPGNGFKFLRTGVKSANWVSLYSLDGISSYNFFSVNQSNHIAPPTGVTAILAAKFEQASNCVTMVGLSDAARFDQDGKEYSPKFPYKLTFSPTPEAARFIPDSQISQNEFLAYMGKIPTGTMIYKVYSQHAPGAADELFGTITTTTECVSSDFGDNHLYFRHQRIEEDWQIRQDWIPDIDATAECGTDSINIIPPQNCTYEE